MAKHPGPLLIVDDDPDILTAGKLLLKRHYERVDTTSNPTDLPRLLGESTYAVILLDMNFGPGKSSGEEGFYWLRKILALDEDAVVVLITAHGGIDLAVEAMKVGATDFIAKPWHNEKVIATLSAAVRLRASRSQARQLQQQLQQVSSELTSAGQQPMLGDSAAMQKVHEVIARTAPTEANVLVLGENGTGKELVARALHSQSRRADQIFLSIDLGAVPESLFESELFGHCKGAFTDARQDRVGRLQAANGGTLFLDEIGNLPLHLQAKLLSVLEQRQVTPVGGSQSVEIDVRVVAATNVARETLANEQRFRQDLLFRLNTVEIKLPALRERREDIPAIASYYAGVYGRKYGAQDKQVDAAALDMLTDYQWPGNIRALRHAIERAVILSDGNTLRAADFQLTPVASTASGDQADTTAATLNLETLEKDAITEALKRHRYNISHAAKELGLTRAALYRRMEKHGL